MQHISAGVSMLTDLFKKKKKNNSKLNVRKGQITATPLT